MRIKSVAALIVVLVLVPVADAAASDDPDRSRLGDYAQRTWASFSALTDPPPGLPADILNSDGSRSVQTSTTNIGAYLWSAVTAHRLDFISQRELVARLSRTLTT